MIWTMGMGFFHEALRHDSVNTYDTQKFRPGELNVQTAQCGEKLKMR